MLARFSSPRTPPESVHGFPPPMDVNNDDFYDYHNSNDMLDEDSLLCEGVDHGFDSDVEDEIPDGLPRARTFSLLMGRSNSSEQ